MPLHPIVLPSHRPAARFYRGGRRITELRGDPPAGSHEPEDWIASVTDVADRSGAGLTTLPDGRRLVDAVAADPVGWLGPAHLRSWGADPKLLVKLLDAGQRLPVHAHPDAAFAAAHLDRHHGKAEAWFILSPGTVHLGLRRSVTSDQLRALVEQQDVDALLGLLHAIPVEAGDAVFVPAGELHAIGEGVLLLEVQEPEDLSILLEWRGFALDGTRDGHLGLGFETALAAVDHDRIDESDVHDLVTRAAAGSVLPASADRFFTIERLQVDGPSRLAAAFAVLLVLEGRVVVDGHAHPAGTTLVVPFGSGDVPVDGTGVLLVCRPPLP